MRTHCVGRYLIDLPEAFQQEHHLSAGPADATLYFGRNQDFKTVDITVVAERVNQEKFQRAVDSRATSIAEQTNYAVNGSMLVAQEKWAPATVLLRYYASPDVDDSLSHELHALVGDVHLALKTSSFDGNAGPAELRLRSLVPQIHRIDEHSTVGAGFCLGSVVVSSQHDYEEAKISFSQSNRKQDGVRFVVDYNTFPQPENEPSLIARGESNLQGLSVHPQIIRKGSRRLAGTAAEEWLGEFRSGDLRQLSFYAETVIPSDGRSQPTVHVELHSGGQNAEGEPVGTGLSALEAAGIWDAALDSLRKLPGN